MKKVITSLLSLILVLGMLGGNLAAFAGDWDTDPVPLEPCNHTFKEVVLTKAGPGVTGAYCEECTKCHFRTANKTIYAIAGVRLDKLTFEYDGKQKKPGIIARDKMQKTIDSKYYDVTYENNSVVGKKTRALIVFKGRYTGAYYRDFTIHLAKPTVKVDKVGETAVKLSWSKVAGAKYYRVYEYLPQKNTYQRLVSTKNLTYTVRGKAGGSDYYFLVRAYFVNGSGKEFLSPYTKADCVKAVTLCTPPKASAAASGKNVNLSWARVPGASYYRIFRYDPKTGKYITLINNYRGKTFVAQNQPKGTNYYLVRAFNSQGGGSAYNTKILAKAVVK